MATTDHATATHEHAITHQKPVRSKSRVNVRRHIVDAILKSNISTETERGISTINPGILKILEIKHIEYSNEPRKDKDALDRQIEALKEAKECAKEFNSGLDGIFVDFNKQNKRNEFERHADVLNARKHVLSELLASQIFHKTENGFSTINASAFGSVLCLWTLALCGHASADRYGITTGAAFWQRSGATHITCHHNTGRHSAAHVHFAPTPGYSTLWTSFLCFHTFFDICLNEHCFHLFPNLRFSPVCNGASIDPQFLCDLLIALSVKSQLARFYNALRF